MARERTKTEVATIKLTPACRRAWEAAASRERRSLANMFEVAIFQYFEANQIDVSEAATPQRTRKSKGAGKNG